MFVHGRKAVDRKAKSLLESRLLKFGSSDWTRTSDIRINSPPFYRLITVWLVPGSWQVEREIRAEGIDKVLAEAGFVLRQPGDSGSQRCRK